MNQTAIVDFSQVEDALRNSSRERQVLTAREQTKNTARLIKYGAAGLALVIVSIGIAFWLATQWPHYQAGRKAVRGNRREAHPCPCPRFRSYCHPGAGKQDHDRRQRVPHHRTGRSRSPQLLPAQSHCGAQVSDKQCLSMGAGVVLCRFPKKRPQLQSRYRRTHPDHPPAHPALSQRAPGARTERQ